MGCGAMREGDLDDSGVDPAAATRPKPTQPSSPQVVPEQQTPAAVLTGIQAAGQLLAVAVTEGGGGGSCLTDVAELLLLLPLPTPPPLDDRRKPSHVRAAAPSQFTERYIVRARQQDRKEGHRKKKHEYNNGVSSS
ncbi:hypothetical protein QE152_g7621 [Popillia japonica]|uniref:Uncharacterized protein n=1 Tax=Popillia japonica TaxID=7064 RepID=A0AAW1ME00_POPJA